MRAAGKGRATCDAIARDCLAGVLTLYQAVIAEGEGAAVTTTPALPAADLDVIRRAAGRLRILAAEAATPPDWVGYAGVDGRAELLGGPAEDGYRTAIVFRFSPALRFRSCFWPSGDDIAYIATVHPGVGLAAAAWLASAAGRAADRWARRMPRSRSRSLVSSSAWSTPTRLEAAISRAAMPLMTVVRSGRRRRMSPLPTWPATKPLSRRDTVPRPLIGPARLHGPGPVTTGESPSRRQGQAMSIGTSDGLPR